MLDILITAAMVLWCAVLVVFVVGLGAKLGREIVKLLGRGK